MLNYQNKMKLLFWRMHGKITLRVTIHEVPANITISKELQKKIKNYPRLVWSGDQNLFEGPGSGMINAELIQLKNEINQVHGLLLGFNAEIIAETVTSVYKLMVKKGYPFNFEGLKLCFHDKDIHKKRFTLLECVAWLKEFKRDIEKMEEGTIETYGTRIKNLEIFLDSIKSKDLLAEKFTPAVATQFCDWMRTRHIAKNHIARHIMFFKEALRLCATRETIPFNPLIEFVYSREEKEDLRHLEYDELIKLEQLDLEHYPRRLRQSRDMFVFCCYTGFHYCDREGLKMNDLKEINGNFWIFKTRQKTKRYGAMAKVKLHPKAVMIIQKYGGIAKMPRIDNTDTNYDLKILEKQIGVQIGLSTKIARKTFAHICLNYWLFDSDTSSAMMGLKDTRHIKKYGKVSEKRIDKVVTW